MIKYNKLQIEGDTLIIDFEVEDKPYYKNAVSITGVNIDTPETLKVGKPYWPLTPEDNDLTGYTGEIPISGIKDSLIIITPQVVLDLPSDIPCGADIVDKAAIYDRNILIKKGLGYLKELGDTCRTSKDFIDFILKRHALDMYIATCNYDMAAKFWERLTSSKVTDIKGCGCHGR